MKIAIVRLSSLGDIIFCMASLQLVRRRFPEAEITWVADSRFADILDHNPDLERVVKLNWKGLKKDFSWGGAAAEYRKLVLEGKADIVIDLHGMIKSSVISYLTGQQRCGFHRHVAKEPISSLFYNHSYNVPLELNTVFRYASLTAKSLGFSFDEKELVHKQPFLFFSEEDRLVSDSSFSRTKKNIMFVVGSTWESRNYPKERFISMAGELGENILIPVGSETEFATASFIAERCANVTVLPRMNLNQLKAAVSRVDLLIGGDTGPTHIAWANNVPSVIIFGPTPSHRIYASPTTRILKSSSIVDERKLNKNDFSILEITEQQVLQAAENLMNTLPMKGSR
jgi:heptosyltransferase-1